MDVGIDLSSCDKTRFQMCYLLIHLRSLPSVYILRIELFAVMLYLLSFLRSFIGVWISEPIGFLG